MRDVPHGHHGLLPVQFTKGEAGEDAKVCRRARGRLRASTRERVGGVSGAPVQETS